jgi:hypothetical protein
VRGRSRLRNRWLRLLHGLKLLLLRLLLLRRLCRRLLLRRRLRSLQPHLLLRHHSR